MTPETYWNYNFPIGVQQTFRRHDDTVDDIEIMNWLPRKGWHCEIPISDGECGLSREMFLECSAITLEYLADKFRGLQGKCDGLDTEDGTHDYHICYPLDWDEPNDMLMQAENNVAGYEYEEECFIEGTS